MVYCSVFVLFRIVCCYWLILDLGLFAYRLIVLFDLGFVCFELILPWLLWLIVWMTFAFRYCLIDWFVLWFGFYWWFCIACYVWLIGLCFWFELFYCWLWLLVVFLLLFWVWVAVLNCCVLTVYLFAFNCLLLFGGNVVALDSVVRFMLCVWFMLNITCICLL